MRRPVLLAEGAACVDLDEREMFSMSRRYFERTRFGDVTGGHERLFDALDELTPAQKRGVLYVLAADLVGRCPRYSHNPTDDYRLLARRLGISPADLLPDGSEARRLDYETGTEPVGADVLGGAPRRSD